MAAPQPCRPRSTTLPALMEELVEEILLRIPPDEPARLVRAALVCKAWHRMILSGDTGRFLRRYRAFHRHRPPLLGFFYNDWRSQDLPPRFMPATAIPSLRLAQYRHRHRRPWRVLDCRHGRVLLEDFPGTSLSIWDPIRNDWQELEPHGIRCKSYSAAVLCAAAAAGSCDHQDCRRRRGNPFFVVYVGADDNKTIKARVYSSETRAWSTPVSSRLYIGCYFDKHRAAVIGDELFFFLMLGLGVGARIILRYHLVKSRFSFFASPSRCDEVPVVLMQNEDGSLGLASTRDSKLYLWSRVNAEWVQRRVIKLGEILPVDKLCAARAHVIGFAEGVGILFISTPVGTFAFQLESGRSRKIITRPIDTVFPFISLFTPWKDTAL